MLSSGSSMPIKPFKINNQIVTLQERDPSVGVKANLVVKYFPSMYCILAGEYMDEFGAKSDRSSKPERNAVVTCTNLIDNSVCRLSFLIWILFAIITQVRIHTSFSHSIQGIHLVSYKGVDYLLVFCIVLDVFQLEKGKLVPGMASWTDTYPPLCNSQIKSQQWP